MSEILPIYLGCLFLAYLSHRTSAFSLRDLRYHQKEHVFFFLLTVIAVLFAGLRINYNDTYTYISSYNRLSVDEGWFSNINWSISSHPLYGVSNRIMKLIGFSSQSYLMTYAAFSIGVSLWFIHKYSEDLFLSVFLFFTLGIYIFNMAAIKQCVATAWCLIGVDRFLRRKWFGFIFYVGIGILFHPFSAMFLICPLLTFTPWTLRSYLMILACGFAGIYMQLWLGNALDILSIVGIDYDASKALNDSVNIFRVLVVWAPILVSFTTARYWKRNTNKPENLMMNLSTLCAELMLIAVFGNPVYFGRLANYFMMFQVISLPLVLRHLEFNSRFLIKLFVYSGYSGYAVYREAIRGAGFDANFARITLGEYLSSLF